MPNIAILCVLVTVVVVQHKDKDKDPFIALHELVVGYSKAPEQLQSSARPNFHAISNMGREPATIPIAT